MASPRRWAPPAALVLLVAGGCAEERRTLDEIIARSDLTRLRDLAPPEAQPDRAMAPADLAVAADLAVRDLGPALDAPALDAPADDGAVDAGADPDLAAGSDDGPPRELGFPARGDLPLDGPAPGDLGPWAPDLVVAPSDGGAYGWMGPDLLLPPGDLLVPDGLNPHNIQLTELPDQVFPVATTAGRSVDNHFGVGQGAALGDLDGDGDLDLVLARNDDPGSNKPGGPSLLLRNQGTQGGLPRFTVDQSFAPLVAGARVHGLALGDYDRDGDLDLFLATEGRDLLLANQGLGTFKDVTLAAGVGGLDDAYGVGGLFADWNRDGLLDLYAVNWNRTPDQSSERSRNRLFLNLGDGTFEDVTHTAEVGSVGASWAATAVDLDATGDLWILVANDQFAVDGMVGGPGYLADAWYRLATVDGRGVPRFTDELKARGVAANRSSMGHAIADFDGDLTPDVYIADYGSNSLFVNPKPGAALVREADAFGLRLRNDPAGAFLVSWGVRIVDLDRDGELEALVGNGWPGDANHCAAFHQALWYLRRPAGNPLFYTIRREVGLHVPKPVCPSGVGDPEWATLRTPVQGDLDGDGDDDFVIAPYATRFRLYRNDTPRPFHALRLRLRGTVSSVDPVGAQLIVTHLDGHKTASFVYAGGETLSQSDHLLTVGLGKAVGVQAAEVRWPSGLVQRLDGAPGFAPDRVVTIVEPTWLTVEPRVVAVGGQAQFVYRPVDGHGKALGPAGAGRQVTVERGDGVAVVVADRGDGTYTAAIPHPGATRRATLTLTVDGIALRPRPMLSFR